VQAASNVLPPERAIRTIKGNGKMAKKSKTIDSGNLSTAVPADDGIPPFLKRDVSNNLPDAPEVGEAVAPKKRAPAPVQKRKPAHVPMGMSEEEYNDLDRMINKKKEATPVKKAKAKKEKRQDKLVQPHGTFKIADWARQHDKNPSIMRGLSRGSDAIKALWVKGLKHVYLIEDEPKLAELLGDTQTRKSKKVVKTKKAVKAKKKDDVPVQLPKGEPFVEETVSPKVKARAAGEKAVKEFKKSVAKKEK
jgi:hypothetical protein